MGEELSDGGSLDEWGIAKESIWMVVPVGYLVVEIVLGLGTVWLMIYLNCERQIALHRSAHAEGSAVRHDAYGVK